MSPAIRAARLRDRPGILAVVRDAFSHNGRDGHKEIEIVLSTWSLDAAPDGLELVAVEDGDIVGHVLCARGDLSGREVVAVAPLAVAPSRQRQGTGSALMAQLLRNAQHADWPLVLLLGSPAYYGRFGFEPAGPLGIVYPAIGAGDPHFQVRRLAASDAAYRGEFTYCWESTPG